MRVDEVAGVTLMEQRVWGVARTHVGCRSGSGAALRPRRVRLQPPGGCIVVSYSVNWTLMRPGDCT